MMANILPPLLVGEDLDDIGPRGRLAAQRRLATVKDYLVIVTLWGSVLIWSKRRYGEDQP